MEKLVFFLAKSIVHMGFPDGSAVKTPSAMKETKVQSLDQENPLEEGMANHSSILAWRIPWTEEPGGLESIGSQRVRHDWSNWAHTHIKHLGGNILSSLHMLIFCILTIPWTSTIIKMHKKNREVGSPANKVKRNQDQTGWLPGAGLDHWCRMGT